MTSRPHRYARVRAFVRRGRRARALALAAAFVACASPPPQPVPQRSSEELLQEFRSGRVRLNCTACRYEHRSGDTLLRDGHYDPLVVGILRSGDASGRSWYLLGRAAEAQGMLDVALLYYRESLATSRNPVLAMWPLYDDLHYRIRRIEAPRRPTLADAAPKPEPPGAREVEVVDVRSLVVRDAPGERARVVASLRRGQRVEVSERSGEWERVWVDGLDAGWVAGRFTQPKPSAPAQASVAKAPTPDEPAKPVVAKAPAKAKSKPSARKQRVGAVATPPAAEPPALIARPAAAPPAEKVAAPAREPAPAPEVAKAEAPPSGALAPAASAGILDCPLPKGAALAGTSPSASGGAERATETYSIRAPAREILGFYEREMGRSGWRKSELSSQYLLYFEKGERTVGVLVDRNGGGFTLMGS
jgi:hypothetical protein